MYIYIYVYMYIYIVNIIYIYIYIYYSHLTSVKFEQSVCHELSLTSFAKRFA